MAPADSELFAPLQALISSERVRADFYRMLAEVGTDIISVEMEDGFIYIPKDVVIEEIANTMYYHSDSQFAYYEVIVAVGGVKERWETGIVPNICLAVLLYNEYGEYTTIDFYPLFAI